jgi:hypothetical protein
MSWLFEHRHQFDGLRPFVEIAHWAVISRVPREDQDDMEQEIVISLIGTVEKYGNKGERYLEIVARNRVNHYLHGKYGQTKRLFFIHDSNWGEMVGARWDYIHDSRADARLDAMATLATLPTRLIQIGYKILNEEKLSEADQHYWVRQKAKLRPKLNCRRYANRLSDWEKRRVLQLHSKGMSVWKIARTLGRTPRAVTRVLAGSQSLTRDKWLAKMEMAAKERDELIRHAYFVDGKSITGIKREFHHGFQTVRRAIAASAV